MTMQRKELPFFNVIAGSTATLTLPNGMTYERLMLQMGGTTFNKTHITDIRMRVNGKVIHQCNAADLESINAYSGLATDSKFITIDFTELFARDQVGQSIGALGTVNGVSQAVVEVDIAGTAVAPQLTCWSIISGPRQLTVCNKMLKYNFNIAAAGKWPLALPYGNQGGSIIKRIYIKSNTANGLEIKKNGTVIHESVKEVNEFWQKENKKTPQAGYYIFDPIVDNNQTDMLSTSDCVSFEVNPTFSGPETITVYVEYIDLLGNL
ncbi:major capsid protein P2 [Janthinobacterium sp. B9-8]|uniref:major capsid protein P2 n=1 Tax=Janthinobacterium sp. B9-8 TaxID=1236179 RepID=UPI00069957F7|nr:hypothetical protein VN23_06325 [Janthinobacterium sp. B9-8]